MKNLDDFHDTGRSLTKKYPHLLREEGYLPSEILPAPHYQLELRPYLEEVEPDPQIPPMKFATQIHLDHKARTYSMQSKNRGVLFFVNIINFPESLGGERKGASVDKNNVIWTFRQMGFVIFYYENLLYSELDMLLEKFVRSDYLRHTDCLVFSIMTHGSLEEGKEYVQFSDGGHVNIQDILRRFHNDHCELLQHKPKVFILPYCR